VDVLAPPAARPVDLAGQREYARGLFERLAGLGPDGAQHHSVRAELVEMHLPLARYFALRYAGRGEPFDDLLQVGSLGLVKAVDRFDVTRDVAFRTFAGPTILGELRRHFRDRTWAVHVHRSLQQLTGEVSWVHRDMTQELGRPPTADEIAVRMDLPPERVREALRCRVAYRATSLATPLPGDTTLGDRLGAEDPGFADVDRHQALGSALARLTERERRILQLRFYGNLTQEQIAEQVGVSQMQVSRLLKRVLTRLRADLAETD
jgi:RNA polymerase sigma-B factor